MARTKDAGLSLAEVLVSLSIFSLIGVAGLSLLQSLARTNEQLSDRAQSVAGLNRAFALIETSLLNADPGSVEVTADALVLRLDASLGDMSLRYVFAGDGLARVIETDGKTQTQTLVPSPLAGGWTQNGPLAVVELTLPNGMSGTRSFVVAGMDT